MAKTKSRGKKSGGAMRAKVRPRPKRSTHWERHWEGIALRALRPSAAAA